MKALQILKEQSESYSKLIEFIIGARDPYLQLQEYLEKKCFIDDAISDLENYQYDMDKYLDYTTRGRASKSFNADLSRLKNIFEEAQHDSNPL